MNIWKLFTRSWFPGWLTHQYPLAAMCFYPSFFTKTLLTPFMFLKWFRCIYVEGWFTRTTGISIKVRVNRDDASIKHKHISTFVLTSSWFTRTFSCTYAYVVRVNQPLPRKYINIQLFFCRLHFFIPWFSSYFLACLSAQTISCNSVLLCSPAPQRAQVFSSAMFITSR